MRNSVLCLLLCLAATASICAQEKRIASMQAGGLNEALTKEEIGTLRSLQISGEINRDDIRLLNEMSRIHRLEVIDLSGARFVKSADSTTTFTEFPYPQIKFGQTAEEVKAFEAEAGGTYNEELSGKQAMEYLYVYTTEKNPPCIARFYFVSREGAGVVNEIWQAFAPYDKIGHKGDEGYALNKDFIALLKREGFAEPTRMVDGSGFVTTGENKEMDLSVTFTAGSDLGLSDEVVAVIQYGQKGEYR